MVAVWIYWDQSTYIYIYMLYTRVYIRASIQDVCAYLNMHGGHACTTTCSLVQFNCICRQVAVVLGRRGMGFWDLLGR